MCTVSGRHPDVGLHVSMTAWPFWLLSVLIHAVVDAGMRRGGGREG